MRGLANLVLQRKTRDSKTVVSMAGVLVLSCSSVIALADQYPIGMGIVAKNPESICHRLEPDRLGPAFAAAYAKALCFTVNAQKSGSR